MLVEPERKAVAVKILWPQNGEPGEPAEIRVLSSISHPHIVSLLYFFRRFPQGVPTGIYCLVFDFFPVDMARLLQQKRRLSTLDVKVFGKRRREEAALLVAALLSPRSPGESPYPAPRREALEPGRRLPKGPPQTRRLWQRQGRRGTGQERFSSKRT